MKSLSISRGTARSSRNALLRTHSYRTLANFVNFFDPLSESLTQENCATSVQQAANLCTIVGNVAVTATFSSDLDILPTHITAFMPHCRSLVNWKSYKTSVIGEG